MVSVWISEDERNEMAWSMFLVAVKHWPYNAGRGTVATVSREGARVQPAFRRKSLPNLTLRPPHDDLQRSRLEFASLLPSSMARPVTTRLATPAPQTPIEPATHPDLHAMACTSLSQDNGDAITSVP
jgi:hypothetical protein